jgi:hypothetical protein
MPVRRLKMRPGAVGALAWLLATGMAPSAAVAPTLSYPQDGFSLTLPAGWVEMPRPVVQAYQAQLARLAPQGPRPIYKYGYQLRSAERWIQYPYILVNVSTRGRIPDHELDKIVARAVRGTEKEAEGRLGGIVSGLQFGQVTYDRGARILWMKTSMDVAGVGPIVGLSGMVLTKQGYVGVNGYASQAEFAKYAPIFEKITRSVTPDEENRYEPRWSDRLPPPLRDIDWASVGRSAIRGALIGGLMGLWGFLARRRQQK